MKILPPHALFFLLSIIISFNVKAQVFSELQSARMAGMQNVEFIPMISTVNWNNKDNSDFLQNEIGLQTVFGLSKSFDLGLRCHGLWIEGSDYSDFQVELAIAPKYTLVENRISFSLPVHFVFGVQLHPTVFLTVPVIPEKMEVTLSPKYILAIAR